MSAEIVKFNGAAFCLAPPIGGLLVLYLNQSRELPPTDQWILSRLANVVDICDDSFKSFNLTQAAQSLRTFWWAELCDVYLVKYCFHFRLLVFLC